MGETEDGLSVLAHYRADIPELAIHIGETFDEILGTVEGYSKTMILWVNWLQPKKDEYVPGDKLTDDELLLYLKSSQRFEPTIRIA